MQLSLYFKRFMCNTAESHKHTCSQHFPLLFYNMNNFLRSPFHSNRCHFREKCTSKLFNLRKGASRIHRSPVVVFVVSLSSLSLMTIHLYLVLSVRVCAGVCVCVRVYLCERAFTLFTYLIYVSFPAAICCLAYEFSQGSSV